MRHFPSFSTLHAPSVLRPRARAVALDACSPADMMNWFCAPLFALAVFFLSVDFAESKRLGEGKSFGSKGSYSKATTSRRPRE